MYNTGASYIAQSCPVDGNGQITQNCHMLNLPTTVTTYLGGTQVGQTTNTYDTYTGDATLDAASGKHSRTVSPPTGRSNGDATLSAILGAVGPVQR